MKKGYWIAHVTVKDPEAYQEYVRLDTPVVEQFGGVFKVRGGQSTAPEGAMLERHVVVEFPSYEVALECYNSADYQRAAEIRRATSDSQIVIVEGH